MNRLKLLKKMHKINQEDLAKVLDTNRVQISRYETGKRKLDEDQIARICRYYHVSADWLLGLDEDWQTKHAARISRGVFVCVLWQEWPSGRRGSPLNVEQVSREGVRTNRGGSHTCQPLTLWHLDAWRCVLSERNKIKILLRSKRKYVILILS